MSPRAAATLIGVALLVGLLVGYLMWGRPMQRALDELESLKIRQAELAGRADSERKRLAEELSTERERRQRLEELVSRGRK